jgi:DNA ligase (NAD+)
MNLGEAKAELKYLRAKIRRHDNLYYNLASPEISDSQYDELRMRLNAIEERFKELVTKTSPSKQVGAPIFGSHFRKITHKKPMLSLDNAFSKADIFKFMDKVSKFLRIDQATLELCGEQKIDGLSASIVYKDGEILYGATRGNGYLGEDVTGNLKTIADVPERIGLPGEIEIRGEVYMPTDSFMALNEERKLQAESLFVNPRNAAAGSIRQLDAAVTASRNLKFFAYYMDSFGNDLGIATQIDMLQLLQELEFSVAQYRLCRNVDEVMDYYEQMLMTRNELEYEIDGAVFKINSLKLQEDLGFVGRSPRHSIAFKFPAGEAKTDIIDIVVSVGRTGKITPIAIVSPVIVGGATVSKATLHNFEEISRKGIAIGDTVTISRSGDVIPKITSVVEKSGNCVPQSPTTCPSCGSTLEREGESIDLFCMNYHGCPSQFARYAAYFVSKHCFDIPGFGAKQIEEFIWEGRIKSVIDIFRLKEMDDHGAKLAQKPTWGEISANKLYAAIDSKRTITLPRFITSLAILGVGEITARLLADKFETIDNLMNATKVELRELDGLGKTTTEHICSYMSNPKNIEFVQDLLRYVTIIPYKRTETMDTTSMFYKKTVVFTGKLERTSRSQAKQIAASRGAIVTSSISSKTDFVIVGNDAGSKLGQAKMLGVTLLTEDEFLQHAK